MPERNLGTDWGRWRRHRYQCRLNLRPQRGWHGNSTPTITTSGVFAITPTAAQTSHQVIGTCGTATTFAPCTLTAGDIPSLSGTYLPIPGGTMTGAAYMDGPIYDAAALGLACNYNLSLQTGTDDTAALNAALATLQTNGGGTIRFPPHAACAINGHIVVPNDNTVFSGGTTNPYARQSPIRLTGTSPSIQNGQRGAPSNLYTGSMLVMRYAPSATGGLIEQSVYAGGSGYVVGDTGTVGGTCSGTTYTIEAADTGTYTVGTAARHSHAHRIRGAGLYLSGRFSLHGCR